MEKLLQPYDKEYMKMAMLKHEETFKEQVHELHRLYRIQKILMKNIENTTSGSNGWNQQEIWNSKNNGMMIKMNQQTNNLQQKPRRKNLDLEQPAEDYIAESDGDGVLEIEDESEIELTLGPTSYNIRKKAESTTPLTSDSGPSFSSSSTGSSQIKKTSYLGTHQRTDRTREELSGRNKWGSLVNVPNSDTNQGFQSGRKNSLDVVEEQLRQERLKHPPWLFQVLSLNMT